MMSTTMGYTCGCGSFLKAMGKRNISNHKKTHKHMTWKYGTDYKKIKSINLEVQYTTTYGRCKVWHEQEDEVCYRPELTPPEAWLCEATIEEINELMLKKDYGKISIVQVHAELKRRERIAEAEAEYEQWMEMAKDSKERLDIYRGR